MLINPHKIERAIAGVLDVADSNFPGPTDIRIEAIGVNRASVLVPASIIRELLQRAPLPENPR